MFYFKENHFTCAADSVAMEAFSAAAIEAARGIDTVCIQTTSAAVVELWTQAPSTR